MLGPGGTDRLIGLVKLGLGGGLAAAFSLAAWLAALAVVWALSRAVLAVVTAWLALVRAAWSLVTFPVALVTASLAAATPFWSTADWAWSTLFWALVTTACWSLTACLA